MWSCELRACTHCQPKGTSLSPCTKLNSPPSEAYVCMRALPLPSFSFHPHHTTHTPSFGPPRQKGVTCGLAGCPCILCPTTACVCQCNDRAGRRRNTALKRFCVGPRPHPPFLSSSLYTYGRTLLVVLMGMTVRGKSWLLAWCVEQVLWPVPACSPKTALHDPPYVPLDTPTTTHTHTETIHLPIMNSYTYFPALRVAVVVCLLFWCRLTVFLAY